MDKKIIHYIIEICLFIVCINIGRFEDLFILRAFIVTTVYNLIYVIYFRKLTGEGFWASIFNIILIWAGLLALMYILYSIWIFFAGYTDYGLFGYSEGTTYYGTEALANNLLVVIFAPVALINIIYVVVYCLVKRKKRKKQMKEREVLS